jgi:hypothetical protein
VARPLSEATAITSLRDSDAPAFHEPWQAKAFAMVVLLHRQDRFEWDEWVRVLGAEIAAAAQQPGEDPGRLSSAIPRRGRADRRRAGHCQPRRPAAAQGGLAPRLPQYAARPCGRAGRRAPCTRHCRRSRPGSRRRASAGWLGSGRSADSSQPRHSALALCGRWARPCWSSFLRAAGERCNDDRGPGRCQVKQPSAVQCGPLDGRPRKISISVQKLRT